MSLPDYYNRVNPDLLAAIPPDAKVVVEVGCGAGAMGQRFLQLNPGVKYIGVESHEEAAALAVERLQKVVKGNAETMTDEEFDIELGSADALVYGDVLEHFVDPWKSLTRHAGWVRPGGAVVCCIPNVQHWSLLVRVLTGQWLYEDEGLLDRTHLRFFSVETIYNLFQTAGLTVNDIRARSDNSPNCQKIQPLLKPLLEAVGMNAEQYAARSNAIQYIVRGTKNAGAA